LKLQEYPDSQLSCLLQLKGESLSAARLADKFYPIIKATDAKLASATNEDA